MRRDHDRVRQLRARCAASACSQTRECAEFAGFSPETFSIRCRVGSFFGPGTRPARISLTLRVRDGLRIHVLRSKYPRALIARILIGGIFADTNRFFNDQISLQNSHYDVGGGRISSILGANTGTDHLRHRIGCVGSAPASRSPDRDGESAATTGERSAGSVGESEHHHQSIAAK